MNFIKNKKPIIINSKGSNIKTLKTPRPTTKEKLRNTDSFKKVMRKSHRIILNKLDKNKFNGNVFKKTSKKNIKLDVHKKKFNKRSVKIGSFKSNLRESSVKRVKINKKGDLKINTKILKKTKKKKKSKKNKKERITKKLLNSFKNTTERFNKSQKYFTKGRNHSLMKFVGSNT